MIVFFLLPLLGNVRLTLCEVIVTDVHLFAGMFHREFILLGSFLPSRMEQECNKCTHISRLVIESGIGPLSRLWSRVLQHVTDASQCRESGLVKKYLAQFVQLAQSSDLRRQSA